MNECGCKWDGNLDGRMIRCRTHQRIFLKERGARKQAESLFVKLMAENQ